MVDIALGASISGTIGANPAGTTYNLAAGTFYGQQFLPQAGDTYIGDPSAGGTVISGAGVITSWTGAGSAWKATSAATDTSGVLGGTVSLSTYTGIYGGIGTATFSGTTMTVTAVTSGSFSNGALLYCANVPQGTYILSGAGGGTGAYTLSASVGTLGSRAVKITNDTNGGNSTNPLAGYEPDLFVDGVMYTRIAKPGPATAGTWWWDDADSSVNVNTNLTGHLVELSLAPYLGYDPGNDGITYRNIIIEKYANHASFGVIHGQNANHIGMTFRHNHGTGCVFAGTSGHFAKNCLFYHNGQLGCVASSAKDFLLTSSEISSNNYAGYKIDWEAGGLKVADSENITVQDCHVHDNIGTGLWWDLDCTNTLVQDNLCENNTGSGIFYEVSHGRTRITRNRCINNLGAGIYISTSNNVEVDNNICIVNPANTGGDHGGIFCLNDDRGAAYALNFLNVHDNVIINTATGPLDGILCPHAITAPTWTFDNNTWVLPDTTGVHWTFDLPDASNTPNNVTFTQAKTAGYETGPRTSVVVGGPPVTIQAMLNSIRAGQTADSITELVMQTLILSLFTTLRVPV